MSTMHPMSTGALRAQGAGGLATWVAWALVALAAALGLGALPLVVAVTRTASAPGTPWSPEAVAQLRLSALGWEGLLGKCVIAWVFAALGALIVARSPARALGWLFGALGVALVLDTFAGYYALYALVVAPGALPGGSVAGWVQHWSWLVEIALLLMLVPLRFPTGRLVSARWRSVWWLAVGVTVAWVLLVAFQPGPLFNYLGVFDVANPLGIAGLGAVAPALGGALLVLLLVSVLLAATSLVVRLGRARGAERLQMKWFAYCALLLALDFVLSAVVHDVLSLSVPALDLALSLGSSIIGFGLVVAIGLSILRYRLFDIDVLIRLTLLYGTLTAILAGAYVSLVVGAQAAVRAVTRQAGQQPVVIVATTLLVAALFTPLRRGVQAAIDRRFYRRRVDAERTLAAFGQTLRGEVDLAQLTEHLLAVVEETMQPEHVSLWLRVPPPVRSQETRRGTMR